MTKDQQLAQLRQAWRAGDDEARAAITITANALIIDDPRHRDTVQRRVAAHLKIEIPREEQPSTMRIINLFEL
jgi:hypothetical protein